MIHVSQFRDRRHPTPCDDVDTQCEDGAVDRVEV